MPIDLIKISNLNVQLEKLLSNDFLQFPQHIDENTGEIISKDRTAEYKGLLFTVTPEGIIKLKGSIHKYKNDGKHNHDDFYLSEIIKVLIDLKEKFSIDPVESRLSNFEFAVNIITPYNPVEFIDDLISHKGRQFNKSRNKDMYIATAKYDNYVLKVYSKSLQYGLNRNILRIELKTLRMCFIKDSGIKTLYDLTIEEKLHKLLKPLINKFSEIIYWDHTIEISQIENMADRQLLSNGNNPRYWEQIKKTKGKNWNKTKKRFQDLVIKYGKNNYSEIPKLISNKFLELLDVNSDSLHLLTDLQFQTENVADILPQNKENTPFNNLGILSKGISLSLCPVTGLDISMQRPGSRFLCVAGIKHYYENDNAVFTKLMTRLSRRWHNATSDVKFREIAHSVRNEFYNPKNNPRNNTLRAITRVNQNTLFDTLEFISPAKLQLAGLQ